MASYKYKFLTRWKVQGSAEQVYDILIDAEGYNRWWQAANFKTRVVEKGEPRGLNQIVDLSVKGWLGYTIRWRLVCTEAKRPSTIILEATGDFCGRGVWNLKQDGGLVEIIYDWQVCAENFFLKYFSWILRPLFSANHDWLMKQGERGLIEELKRRALEPHLQKPRGV